MFHKNVANSLRSVFPEPIPESTRIPTLPQLKFQVLKSQTSSRIALVPPGGGTITNAAISPGFTSKTSSSSIYDLAAIAAHRCSSFFAEAAVLVLVLALLDRFMLKGRMEMNWVVSAFTISLVLLAASVFTEFSCRRWLERQ
jgi:hypothetical protein